MSTILRTTEHLRAENSHSKKPPLWLLSVFLTFNPHLWTTGHAWTELPLFQKKRFCMLRKLLQQAEIIIIMFELKLYITRYSSRLNTPLIFIEKILPRTLLLFMSQCSIFYCLPPLAEAVDKRALLFFFFFKSSLHFCCILSLRAETKTNRQFLQWPWNHVFHTKQW